MKAIKSIQQQSGKYDADFDPMFGAAIVTEDGREIPITVEQVDKFLEDFVLWEEAGLLH